MTAFSVLVFSVFYGLFPLFAPFKMKEFFKKPSVFFKKRIDRGVRFGYNDYN